MLHNKIYIYIYLNFKDYAHQRCHMLVKLVKTSQDLSLVANQRFEVANVEESFDFLCRLFLHLHLFRAYITLGFFTLMNRSTPSLI